VSLGKVYTVHCDCPVLFSERHKTHSGKHGSNCVGWVAETSTASRARHEARRQGWKRAPGLFPVGYDLCPACVDADVPEVPPC
jgi:hypothetical protein